MTVEEKKITLKLVVDKEKKRVVFSEADKDFVDILCSFLTLPVGTIIRLLGKQSVLGSISNLYESIENLDAKHFQTEACKTMLLSPLSSAAYRCEDLKLNIDDTNPRKVFHCDNSDCCAKSTCLGSSVANARCSHCQQCMNSWKNWPKRKVDSISETDGDGVFIKGGVTFMISDDLQVSPASLGRSIYLIRKLRIEDSAVLEERTLDLGTEEILKLLERSLISKSPLTGICFNTMETIDDSRSRSGLYDIIQVKTESNPMTNDSKEKISVKLLVNRENNKVLCAEGDEDFADIILSFLTLPLASVIKLLNVSPYMGCVDNLYKSVQDLSSDYIKSIECTDMLLSPKLASFFSCNKKLLKMDEVPPREGSSHGHCYACYWEDGKDAKCVHFVEKAVFVLLNPKLASGRTEVGGGYAKGPGKFMVTDDLRVSPLTAFSTVQVMSSYGSPFSELVETEALIEQVQVLSLLRAAIISKTPLSDVFFPDKKQNYRRMNSAGASCQRFYSKSS